jgi:hypothetical protein
MQAAVMTKMDSARRDLLAAAREAEQFTFVGKVSAMHAVSCTPSAQLSMHATRSTQPSYPLPTVTYPRALLPYYRPRTWWPTSWTFAS